MAKTTGGLVPAPTPIPVGQSSHKPRDTTQPRASYEKPALCSQKVKVLLLLYGAHRIAAVREKTLGTDYLSYLPCIDNEEDEMDEINDDLAIAYLSDEVEEMCVVNKQQWLEAISDDA
ncbi:hypothetical protein NDU88_006698 [Pleurodeles waltl]|uniref:Uncharacterized protein n=1 Tax=Pleurodeles waltl TaxID=8319 RepID=A0AAV7WYB4_PLEWA|nr:hypothetical protein NDU88_006698 [Pleurodeles waltl]